MRTMLILVLLCSLAQFAIAQRALGRSNDKIEIDHQCDTTYKCYMPDMCDDNRLKDAESNLVIDLRLNKQVYSDCSALIKFHSYGKHWAHVSIESLDANINSVTFTASGTPYPAVFSCKRDEPGKISVGEYGPQKTVTQLMGKVTDKLLCTFDVKLATSKQIFGDTIKGEFVINSKKTSQNDISAYKKRCDPSSFKLIDQNDERKVYSQVVRRKPGKYECDNPNISTMEYRKDGKEEVVKIERDKLTCLDDEFAVDGVKQGKNIKLDIRCVADANYFCDYNAVKEKEPRLLERKKADKETEVESALKCPITALHLHVKGRPVFNEEIKCINYGGSSQIWTVGHQTLTAKGPDVYCSDIIKCQTLYKIPESAVNGGSVDKDYLPYCYGKAILQDANKANIEPPFVQCDTSTGNYTYTVGTEKKIVQKDTKFECFHPEVSNVLQNEKDKKTLTIGTIAASVAAALIVVGASVAMWFFARRRIRIRNAKSADMDKKLFDAFATNNDEKEAAKQAIKQATHVNEDVGKHSEFNEMLISVQYDAVCSFSTGRTDGLYDSPPQSDIIDMPAKPTWRKTPRKEDVAKFPKSHTAGKLEPSEMNDVHKRVYDRLTQFTLKKMMMIKKK